MPAPEGDDEDNVGESPEAQFSRDAGAVLGSPYFFEPPPGLPDAAYLKWSKDAHAERDALEDALAAAQSYDALEGKVKAIYDRAQEYLTGVAATEDYRDRVSGGMAAHFGTPAPGGGHPDPVNWTGD